MSSSPPSVPSRALTPSSLGNDNVVVWAIYEDWQQEYKRSHDAHHVWELARACAFLPYPFFLLLMGLSPEALRATQMVAPGTGPGSVATVPLAPSQILMVPQSKRVAMENASPDTVDRVLQRPQSPPTREWHHANSPVSAGRVHVCRS
ncbi:hypothetical protein C0992_012753 [Termitomyces sp. T32_za158]|nr:hypothetical protein C0992_012753 [Termitomyces sp. T32_za158]